MRSDAPDFDRANKAAARETRVVVQLIFSDSSPAFTSHAGISGIPGDVYEGTLIRNGSISQQVWPEEGRSTIGAATVELREQAGETITAELRDQLLTTDPNDSESARDKELRIWVGYSDDFSTFVRVGTLYVDGVDYNAGRYTISARDKTRELRQSILDPKVTVITAAVGAADTTITVDSTAQFHTIPHGTSFLDAPSSTVGYARFEDTGEVFRYTGKTSTTFTGVTRGVFNTKAQAVAFEPSDSRDNWPKVTEVIYLELPGPLAIIALMTGVLDPVASPGAVTLPDHWHLGISWPDDLDQAAFLGIGTDLFDPSNYAAGFQVRLLDPGETDGKAFIERELAQLLGVYVAAQTTGRLTLRRMNRVLPESGWVAKLDSSNVISHGALKHDFSALINQIRVNYNWDGEDYTRSVLFLDTESITAHGTADLKQLSFKGLHTARHTERAIRDKMAVLRDRYAAPPLRLQVTAAAPLNGLELGDVVMVDLADLQDYTADYTGLHRAMEVQRVAVDWNTGAVSLDLFGSTTPLNHAGDNADTGAALADAFYTSEGTNIATLTGYVAASGPTPARLSANLTLTGSASDLRASGSIWYHAGDLTIDAGVTIAINNQAQLRVRGFLTVNGTLDLKGRGYAGATDPDTVNSASTGWSKPGTAGYLGPTRSSDGAWIYDFDTYDVDTIINAPGTLLPAAAGGTSAPRLALDVTAGVLTGLPKNLQGCSGSTGGQVTYLHSSTYGTVKAKGGAGGASGAGLAIICRGLGFGPSGKIDTSGNNGTAGTSSGIPADVGGQDARIDDCPVYSGGGAGGYPGTLYVLLDGDGVPYPAISAATLVANRGSTTITGNSAVAQWTRSRGGATHTELVYSRDVAAGSAVTGRNDSWQGAAANMWTVAHQVQYIPAPPAAQEQPVPAPTGLAATGGLGLIAATWNWPVAAGVSYVEVYAATTNDRAFASRVADVVGGAFNVPVPAGGARYLWIRARDANGKASGWHPSGATSGVTATAGAGAGENPVTARPNKGTYSGSSTGSIYVHGFDTTGNPTDGPARITFNGANVDVPAGAIHTSQDVDEGWLIFETSGSSPFTQRDTSPNVARKYAAAYKSRAGWRYDDGTAWATFTATDTMVAIGSYRRASGSITTVATLGNAITLAAVPYEKATTVYSGDIAAGAISDLDAFASTIRPVKVVGALPSLPSSQYPDGTVVVLTSDHKLYRADYSSSPNRWVKTVDGGDLVAASVTAAAIAAGAISASKIAANSITADRLRIGGDNFIDDPDFAYSTAPSTTGWSLNGTAVIDATGGRSSSKCLKVTAPSGYAMSNTFPVREGDELFLEGYFKTSATLGAETADVLALEFFDANGTSISYSAITITGNLSSYTRKSGSIAVPLALNVASARLYCVSAATGSVSIYADSFRVSNKARGELIVDGSITADKLSAAEVYTVSLAASELIAEEGVNSLTVHNLDEDSQSALSAVVAPTGAGQHAWTSMGTSGVGLGVETTIIAPGYQPSTDWSSKRIPRFEQPFILMADGLIHNKGASSRTVTFEVRYRYDGGSWKLRSSESPQVNTLKWSVIVAAGAVLPFGRIVPLKCKASGWTNQVDVDLYLTISATDANVIVSGRTYAVLLNAGVAMGEAGTGQAIALP